MTREAAGHLLCLGLGYSARVLARRLAASGWLISGTSRTAEGAAAIAREGWRGLVFDGRQPSLEVRGALPAATHVLVSVPPGPAGDAALALHGADIARAPAIAWIGYLSTVGVYGDHGGGWVDETTPPAPVSERGVRRLAAERAWLELGDRPERRVQVLRLPGIYGPGRSALDALRAGTARRIVKAGQVFNRIHVEDIATALERAMVDARAPAILNVTDDEPAPPEDVIAFAAGLLGLPVPPAEPFETARLTPMAASFYAESKRVSNARLRRQLGVGLAYPTYREGLRALAAQM